MYLDGHLFRELRQRQGLTEGRLAQLTGVRTSVIHDIEALGAGEITVSTLYYLARLLHAEPSDLLRTQPVDADTAASVKTTAALLLSAGAEGVTHQHLQQQLQLAPSALRRVVAELRHRVRPAGMHVHIDRDQRYRLAARAAPTFTLQDEELAPGTIHALQPREIDVLYDIVISVDDRGWQSHEDRQIRDAVATLIAAGLITNFRGQLRPTDAVITSLDLQGRQTKAEILQATFTLVDQHPPQPPATPDRDA